MADENPAEFTEEFHSDENENLVKTPVVPAEKPADKPAEEAPTDSAAQPTEANADGETAKAEDGLDAAQKAAQDQKKHIPKGVRERFKELSEQRDRAREDARQAAAQAELYKAMVEGREAPQDGSQVPIQSPNTAKMPTPEEIQRLVQAEAAKQVAQQEQARKTKAFFDEGKKDFADFEERCTLLDNLGAVDRPEFVQFVTEMPEGAKIVGQLADDPEEARRIFTLPTTTMAIELAKIGLNLSKPSAPSISRAPAPIKPIDGGAKPSEELTDNVGEAEWYRLREKQVRERTRGARF